VVSFSLCSISRPALVGRFALWLAATASHATLPDAPATTALVTTTPATTTPATTTPATTTPATTTPATPSERSKSWEENRRKTPNPTTSTPAETAAACHRWTGLKSHPAIVSVTRRALGRRCVERLVVRSKARGRSVPVDVLLPDVDPATVGRLPTLTLLGGLAAAAQDPEGSVNYWTILVKLHRALDTLEAGTLTPRLEAGLRPAQRPLAASFLAQPVSRRAALYVLPHTETSPANPAMHAYLGQELVDVIDTRYPTRAERAGRGIDGICFGGVEAVLTALAYSETFGMTGVMQPAMELKESLKTGMLRSAAKARRPHIHLLTSDRDNYHDGIVDLRGWMKTHHPDHEFHDYLGGHGFAFYENVGGPLTILRYLQWFDGRPTHDVPWDQELNADLPMPVATTTTHP
jgi:S-formylglutathione hydrolase FrmB